jgi:hypothetical protein
METSNIKTHDPLKDEKTVMAVGNAILAIGLIAAMILIVAGFMQYKESYSGDTPINWMFILTGVWFSLTSLAVWGVLGMLSNISTTLKSK